MFNIILNYILDPIFIHTILLMILCPELTFIELAIIVMGVNSLNKYKYKDKREEIQDKK